MCPKIWGARTPVGLNALLPTKSATPFFQDNGMLFHPMSSDEMPCT